ncbi:nth [Wigglesworthia glossinidia endosymbiont of Glossina brevipalpis]|uniref:Endonuclease III n=1 Tax=Wigglesworthia glossinidia brevipalpis TaxID=36870 RepID=Q8D2L5_WIGBR|nr:nth [Wigglesworthia glossinidia endosymbiont of Glossina brevipalpis]
MHRTKVTNVFLRLKKFFPNSRIELKFKSNFELFIAVLLSSRTKDAQVNFVTKNLFSKANNPYNMIKLGEKIKYYIKSIGFFNRKTDFILKSCNILLKKFNGKIPSKRKHLESLPGIGRKSANVILNVAFGFETIAVDTHVLRVSNRIGLSNSNNLRNVENTLDNIVPKEFKISCHSLLVLQGRYICKSKRPNCKICKINDLCKFYKNNL